MPKKMKNTQFYNKNTGRWQKRDVDTGKIINVKSDKEPFKNIEKERK